MPIRVLAFDVHGTLAHWPRGRVQPIDVQRLLARVGIDISYQAYEAARQSVFFIDGAKRRLENWMDCLALLFDRLEVRVPLDVLPAVAHLYEQRDDMDLFPDALPALDAARAAGLVACAFTSLPAFMLGRAADEILPRLDHYFDSGLIGFSKGDRRFYTEIARRLGVRPHEILSVGDEYLGDCELPADQGWHGVWLDRAGKDPSVPNSIRSLSELPVVIKQLQMAPGK